jgi:hypothetical protein
MQEIFANKIKLVQAWIDARGHHSQHIFLSVLRLSEHTVLHCQGTQETDSLWSTQTVYLSQCTVWSWPFSNVHRINPFV